MTQLKPSPINLSLLPHLALRLVSVAEQLLQLLHLVLVVKKMEMVHHFAFFALGFPSYRSPKRSFF